MSDLKPMLLHTANGLPDNGEAWVMEPKFDGWRFVVQIDADRQVQAFTRTGHPMQLHGIEDELPKSFPANTVLDMEVVVDGVGKQSTDVPTVLANPRAGHLVAYVFDILELDGHDLRLFEWSDRRKLLEIAARSFDPDYVRLTLVTEPSQEVIDAWIAEGMEGVVLKRKASRYQGGKRSRDWLKIKPTQTIDVRITRLIEGAGKRAGQANTIEFPYRDGVACATVPSYELATEMWQNPDAYIGRLAEVAYYGPTTLGYLRHPQLVRMRPDKDEELAA